MGYCILLCLPLKEPLGTHCFPGTGLGWEKRAQGNPGVGGGEVGWRSRHIHNYYAKCSQTPGALCAGKLKALKSNVPSLVGGHVRDDCLKRSTPGLSLYKYKEAGRSTEWKSYFLQEKQKPRMDLRRQDAWRPPIALLIVVSSGMSWG